MSIHINEDPTIRMRRCHRTFLRQIELAMACVAALEIAIGRRDRDRVSAILMSLHLARGRATAALEECALDPEGATYAAAALHAIRDATDRLLAAASELFAETVLHLQRVADN